MAADITFSLTPDGYSRLVAWVATDPDAAKNHIVLPALGPNAPSVSATITLPEHGVTIQATYTRATCKLEFAVSAGWLIRGIAVSRLRDTVSQALTKAGVVSWSVV